MRILIVDDHAIVRDGLSRLLAIDGDHEIRMAASGREALVAARAFRPALTILDLNLPGLGGLELLRRLVQGEGGNALENSQGGPKAVPGDGTADGVQLADGGLQRLAQGCHVETLDERPELLRRPTTGRRLGSRDAHADSPRIS